MSKIKLVIKIDEENYKRIKDDVYDTHDIHRAIISIRKGIPLDDIKAEILLRDTNVKAVRTDGCCFFTAEEIFEIIDKHIAEGSEKNE